MTNDSTLQSADTSDQSPIDQQEALTNTKISETYGIVDPFAFTNVLFVKATLPHSVRSAKAGKIVLHNGSMTVTMTSTSEEGILPYGHLARLFLIWLTREVHLRKNDPNLDSETARTIPLKGSAHRILHEMGLVKPGKRAGRSQYLALTQQIERLTSTTISVSYSVKNSKGQGRSTNRMQISDQDFFWYDHEDGSGKKSEDFGSASHLVLSEVFFDWLTKRTVPLSMFHIVQFHRYSLTLDLYGWAAYRKKTHSGYTRVTWEQLKGQLGSGYPDTPRGMADFRRKVRISIVQIKKAWSEAGIEEWSGGIVLDGKETPIKPLKAQDESSASANF